MAAIMLISVALLFLGCPFLYSADSLLSFVLWFDCEFFRIETVIFFLWISITLSAIEVLVCEHCGNKNNILFVCWYYFVGKVVQVGI